MSVKQRQQVLSDFKTKPEVTVLLLSLKAASVGLNITCACHVVLMDLWWNPAVEDQAIDRAHRIGQQRPVNVTRLVVRGAHLSVSSRCLWSTCVCRHGGGEDARAAADQEGDGELVDVAGGGCQHAVVHG